ncbi:glycosyl transferase family A [Hahella sp. CCB-MM4]|uniref:glycosyltransferase n=1 Tax=Hahella sp. (strain CCB-MM4) TaxID=1926491 RepID=UPI000B9A668B|nr:glycosyltransferase family A protein [Hahella sp. CCB-MM4]OZG73584.1 glycosyl transferase family A [Hahella sp. CCB-MM4]
MIVSFIIPHKGRTEMLEQTVSSVLNLQHPDVELEVLVITQNDHLDIKTEETPGNTIRIYQQPESLTISHLRNFGFKQAKGDYIAFLDADVALSPNWLIVMLDLLKQEPGRVLVSAMQRNSDNAPVLERIRTALSNAETDCDLSFLPGRNLFMRRETVEKVGGFPEHLTTCEDYYFTYRVSELGSMYYSSAADYVHLGEDKALRSMFDKEIWRGQSNLHSIRGRKIPLSEVPSFLVPMWILFFALAFLVAGFVGQLSLSLLCLLFAILPVLAYSLRLYGVANREIEFVEIIKFYLVYFPARIIGTLVGLFKSISAGS